MNAINDLLYQIDTRIYDITGILAARTREGNTVRYAAPGIALYVGIDADEQTGEPIAINWSLYEVDEDGCEYLSYGNEVESATAWTVAAGKIASDLTLLSRKDGEE